MELNARIALQSSPAMQPERRHARTRLGTTPSMVTPARCTNSPNSRPVGAPSNSAMAAPLTRLA